ncbi:MULTISPECIES: bifunctional diaminohydroxyphosphoribosylaminopyrimidine deaminase/5-amino-6-(5-phosphoribosylamino)uracil reductase RibD [Ensifer]|jgi:diaminohydroxyphosphoribosylaminopyrimidine deaminase / 5-amino-6-(5-phosphoribosylamino)uracil reductase|uniref:Riboflavin biosynthesis protein RibD n=1 Tax=Ensifer canadensis TaxID=555315 RepID=A0AAW4FC16_9HYPH|nr:MULTISPECIES: bifunctional diaminohydroxyphosphoribosylaminopyrimidine deaminase/5-amino-6-(5-phosphoribosylamino)uracil reductase RibD [Ensifer]KQU71985.1 bifunctional diaminohydroxyphosphoribosylaminopyrimidine deaminase/5-amino-6-(5-phosphoribosylamino)uracil reductase [Ensifer sp. Root31]KQW44172.1 bifunctional diaminohydroxyphosphoribosylaminopyrimidine deaminase/5-amino-6-(5-phosphoribosylamino)uracil reductase [Ensifer sp. Root1252]KQW84323.1 bifunctional diaminohydroxyphosphoribosylam
MANPTREDERFMAAALRLARHHLGQTSTNPSVACLIVKDGIVVGRAVTASSGRPHAEAQALAEARERARRATAYVTLEPCSHHGKTPPCADALVAAGVARVVISILDPDERVAGRGVVRLRDAGITVDIGLLPEEGHRALEAYLMRQVSKRPHVTLKLAISADGMIGRKGAGQVRITGPISRAQVQILRAQSDAILVGIGTATADDPELTVRLPGLEDRSPVRIVLDRRLDLSPGSKLVRSARDVPLIVVSGEPSGQPELEPAGDRAGRRAALEAAGVEVLETGSVADLLTALGSRGISSLLVEGGAVAARAFLESGLVDRIQIYTGPQQIGENGIASPFDRKSVPAGFTLVNSARYGDDLFEEYEREN